MKFSPVIQWIRSRWLPATKGDLEELEKNMATKTEELNAKLTALADQFAKGTDEVVAEIRTLKDALANTTISPEADASLTRLAGLAQALDDLNPDAPATPTPTPTPPA